MTNEIPVVFHNGSNYDYHFIIKELANGFEGQFECLGENKERYKMFFVPTQKLIKMIMKVLQLYLTKQNLLIAQALWQANNHIMLIILNII